MSSRVAIVTGSASGIGKAVALQLSGDGFDVVLNDLSTSQTALDAVLREITDAGRKAIMVTGDVSVEGDVSNLVNSAVDHFGGLDVMVANAGVELPKLLEDRACSTAGKKNAPRMGAYGSTKFAIRGLTQAAAQEYGEHGLIVNAYAPGPTITPLLNRVADSVVEATGGEQRAWLDSLAPFSALRRNGTPEDIARFVSFLASEKARFITGQTITVDGGTFFD
ncbi:acetoin reductase [Punctularia strigosozonata HHB-11173 SS5]|uniref:3-oxoacyl-[acyl-carrier-protein] reductase n=1 Tax=Punctularia strigosozonata (strain HHB-11173) TaxID=741275 RepID=R7S4Q3_PUNST|nr:acetoin reductase [Punctularia strigosozonata HHB-11173 SS5]EIN04782.1 acetoin reductase [Punctularia strigosozonata HHB-11173 SS5]